MLSALAALFAAWIPLTMACGSKYSLRHRGLQGLIEIVVLMNRAKTAAARRESPTMGIDEG